MNDIPYMKTDIKLNTLIENDDEEDSFDYELSNLVSLNPEEKSFE